MSKKCHRMMRRWAVLISEKNDSSFNAVYKAMKRQWNQTSHNQKHEAIVSSMLDLRKRYGYKDPEFDRYVKVENANV